MALEEEGIVVEVRDDRAVVAVTGGSACDKCPSASLCKGDGEQKTLTAVNPFNAKAGDRVRVVMHSQMYLKGTMLVYGIPMVLFIGGAMLGKFMADHYFPDWNADLTAAGVGTLLLVLSFGAAKVWSRKVEGNEAYLPVIEKIL